MSPEAKGTKVVTPHHWIIEVHDVQSFSPTDKGFCKHCGITKRFPNGFDASYEPRRDPNDIQHRNRLWVKRGFGDS